MCSVKHIINEKQYKMKVNMVNRYSYGHIIALGYVQSWFYWHDD